MFSFTPSLEHQDAAKNLQQLFSPSLSSACLAPSILKLQHSFDNFIKFCPPPWPATGLQLTPEINYQSELWLPLAEIRQVFHRFYRTALTYQPILASTPFHSAVSWAGIISNMPAFSVEGTANPASLLQSLQADPELRKKFIFWSFMPQRYYGNSPDRYPGQTRFILKQLANHGQKTGGLNLLDAACGDGIGTYMLAGELLKTGVATDRFFIEGWTLDPLEAWSAAYASFPHDAGREAFFRRVAEPVFSMAANISMQFKQADLLNPPKTSKAFDLILCNGLLGGPIINKHDEIKQIIKNLVSMLADGGMILAADCFHGGWKQKCPQEDLRALFEQQSLKVIDAGEGLGAIKQV